MTERERRLQYAREQAVLDKAKALCPQAFDRVRAATGECADGIDPDLHAAHVVTLILERYGEAVA